MPIQLPVLCSSVQTREPLTAAEAGEPATAFKALGDPVRLRLLSLIAAQEGGEACVCDVAGAFDLSQPTISHHLKVLREAGLVTSGRRATWVHYRVVPQQIGLRAAVLVLTAMAVGLAAGRSIPGPGTGLDAIAVDGVSLPIALGLLIMMHPVLAKVRYDRLDTVTGDRRHLLASLVLNWVLGPALMFALAWLLLADLPEYRTGLIIVGLARCIAVVIIWKDLVCGGREAAAVLVALSSIFQVIAFAGLGWFYWSVLPSRLGLPQADLDVSAWQIARSVLIFLGFPLVG